MKILFLSLSNYNTIKIHGLYSDLLRQFVNHGNEVYLLSPVERKEFQEERVIREDGATIVKLRIWNMQKTSTLEKGISMFTIENIFIKGIKKYFYNIKFDLVLYSTPPITLLKAVKYVKKRDSAKTYLLLKDIFPQNAVDIGLMSTKGMKGLIYKYFRKREKQLYQVSDHIGCMSRANVEYVIKHNPEVNTNKVEVCPNTTDTMDMRCSEEERMEIRTKYEIPLDKTIFIYGGNLGKPQDIPFVIGCLKKCQDIKEVYFLIVGSGTEYGKLEKYIEKEKPQNVKLMRWIPKEDYDRMIGSCDVGLIFLDHRFTIPNFPSRLLGYMAAKLPILACTDPNTDIGKTIVEGGFGWWCESNDTMEVRNCIIRSLDADISSMGKAGYQMLKSLYSSENAYEIIRRSMLDERGLV